MYYTENHDQNAWEGTPAEFYGEALETMMMLQFLMPGIPLVHNGQEAGNEARLAFFEKDPIVWQEHPNKVILQKLIEMKKRNPALWNGPWGGALVPVMTDAPEQVTSFIRSQSGNAVLALFNLSPEMAFFKVTDGPVTRNWRDAETGEIIRIELDDRVVLPPWGRLVLEAHDAGGGLRP
jgi:1,4-alpha-glucan branching enzyme